jgi:hypothetical protein
VPAIEWSSLALAVLVSGTAVLLLLWLVLDRRGRRGAIEGEDAIHFAKQDLRRFTVAAVMFIVAAGVYVGSRLPHRVGGRPNPHYLATWATILGLVTVLLVLAMVDWSATQRYAARHRRAMADEGLAILRDELRRRAALAPKRSHGPRPTDAPEGDRGPVKDG